MQARCKNDTLQLLYQAYNILLLPGMHVHPLTFLVPTLSGSHTTPSCLETFHLGMKLQKAGKPHLPPEAGHEYPSWGLNIHFGIKKEQPSQLMIHLQLQGGLSLNTCTLIICQSLLVPCSPFLLPQWETIIHIIQGVISAPMAAWYDIPPMRGDSQCWRNIATCPLKEYCT